MCKNRAPVSVHLGYLISTISESDGEMLTVLYRFMSRDILNHIARIGGTVSDTQHVAVKQKACFVFEACQFIAR